MCTPTNTNDGCASSKVNKHLNCMTRPIDQHWSQADQLPKSTKKLAAETTADIGIRQDQHLVVLLAVGT